MGSEHLIKKWKKEGISPEVIQAFRSVKRENYILEENINEAYSDNPLPIGHSQTISQPTTIMIMINALGIKPTDHVLEIGAGSGYNAAIMSKLADKVTSLEIIPELSKFAKENLNKEKITNVDVVNTDGSVGHNNGPYDKIILTASCPKLPEPLIEQLAENGKIIGPVGNSLSQKMVVGRKKQKEINYHDLGLFTFVPLKGKHGF